MEFISKNMENSTAYGRRSFLSTVALTLAAAKLGFLSPLKAQGKTISANTRKSALFANASFDQIKQIKAGVLDMGYAETGPANGPAVILLHGWPYDIHSYA